VTCPATATVSLPDRESGLAGLPKPSPEMDRVAAQRLKRHAELGAK